MSKAFRIARRATEEVALWLLGGFLMWLGLDPESFFEWLLEPSTNAAIDVINSNHARWLFVISSISIIAVAAFVSIKRHTGHGTDFADHALIDPRIGRPDYDAWASAPELSLGQVACLWAGVEPYDDHLRNRANIRFQILKIAVARGHLKIIDNTAVLLNPTAALRGFRLDPEWISPNIRVRRSDLISYAKRKGERPSFLFKRRWRTLWLYSTPR